MAKTRIAVLFGGRSGEHAVSLMSARSVLSALDANKYEIIQIGITLEGKWLSGNTVLESFESGNLKNLYPVLLLPEPKSTTLFHLSNGQLQPITQIDVVFPVLHGTFGEDGTLQGLLEMADLPYVGAGVLASSVGMDKGLFKEIMRTNGILTPDYLVVTRKQSQEDMDSVIQKAQALAPYPLFVKPANLGSSVGITKCKSRSDLLEGILEAARYDRRILIERGINAREIEVSVLGNENPRASIPGEIKPADEFYSYNAKYHDDRSELFIPAPISQELVEQSQELALKAYKAIDCAGMARVDFLLDKDTDELYINEVNTIPGFTKISMYPKLWEASGLPYAALVDELIRLAFERKAERDQCERIYRR